MAVDAGAQADAATEAADVVALPAIKPPDLAPALWLLAAGDLELEQALSLLP